MLLKHMRRTRVWCIPASMLHMAILDHTRCQTHLSQDQPPKFLFNASNPLKCNKLLVDEASMLDLPLAAALLDAVPHHPNLQLVLVGMCCTCCTCCALGFMLRASGHS